MASGVRLGSGHVAGSKGGTGKQSKTGQPAKLLSASSVRVNVLNGSGVQGIAGATAAALGERGFHILSTASASNYGYHKSVVEYAGHVDLSAAVTVASQLPKTSSVVLRQVSSIPPGTVTLILGSDFTKLGPQPSQPLGNLGEYGGYQGSTNPCKGYGSAFAN